MDVVADPALTAPTQHAVAPERVAARRTPFAAIWRREWLVVLLLAALSAFLLFWRLADPPKYIYDEVYHAFTANLMTQNDPRVYQWWNSAQPNPIPGVEYEWTHPPLGKLIIAAGIWMWGNNSWGWRFFSAVWGLFSVLLLYLLVRQLFRSRGLALLAALFLLVDGLMFAEARIGTNDIFQLGFLLAAYNVFVYYLRRPARQGIGWLFLTGLCLGLALSTKWPAIYSIGFMAVIAAVRAFWPARRMSDMAAVSPPASSPPSTASDPEGQIRAFEGASTPDGHGAAAMGSEAAAADGRTASSPLQPMVLVPLTGAVPARRPRPVWSVPARLGYLVCAALALLGLPFGLYVLSYLQMYLQPHRIPSEYAQIGPMTIGPITLGPSALSSSNWWNMFLGEQWQMWHYHTTLNDHHPYYSKWWQWLLDIRPVFYYVDRTDTLVSNTYALGNPILYWVFPLAIVAAAFLIWRQREPWLAFVLGAFLINWLPWSHSPRGLFFYHFLPSIPFLVTLVAYGVVSLRRQPRRVWQRLAVGYSAAVFIGFAFFYTQLAAWPVPYWWADIHYWLPSWQ